MNGLQPLRAVFCVFLLGTACIALGPRSLAAVEHDALQAPAVGGPIALDRVGGEYRITLPSGEAVRTPGFDRAVPTAVAALGDGWLLAGSRSVEPGEQRLFLRRGSAPLDGAADARSLPVPARRWGRVRRDPVLFVEQDALVGMAWLEGQGGEALAVVAAAWNAGGWGEPEMVSPLRRGSQLALAATVLDDGSWLLAWTADDPTDAETVWSRRVGGAWRRPQRVGPDNDVPDITPALTALPGGGALVAWSQYDGRYYRVRTARFSTAEGGAWVDEGWGGPVGSLFPSFAGARDEPILLYRDAAVSGWAAATLDEHGQPARLDRAPQTPQARPILDSATGAVSRFRWPGSGRSALSRSVRVDEPAAEAAP